MVEAGTRKWVLMKSLAFLSINRFIRVLVWPPAGVVYLARHMSHHVSGVTQELHILQKQLPDRVAKPGGGSHEGAAHEADTRVGAMREG